MHEVAQRCDATGQPLAFQKDMKMRIQMQLRKSKESVLESSRQTRAGTHACNRLICPSRTRPLRHGCAMTTSICFKYHDGRVVGTNEIGTKITQRNSRILSAHCVSTFLARYCLSLFFPHYNDFIWMSRCWLMSFLILRLSLLK